MFYIQQAVQLNSCTKRAFVCQRISKRGFPNGHTIWNVWILGSKMMSYSRNMLRITTDQAGWVIATWFFPKGDREKVDGSYPKGWELPNKSHWTTTCSDIWSQICGHYEEPMFELSRHQIDTRACQPTTPTILRPQALKRSRALKITPKQRGLQQIALDSSRFFRWLWRKNREIGSTKGNKTKSFGNNHLVLCLLIILPFPQKHCEMHHEGKKFRPCRICRTPRYIYL